MDHWSLLDTFVRFIDDICLSERPPNKVGITKCIRVPKYKYFTVQLHVDKTVFSEEKKFREVINFL